VETRGIKMERKAWQTPTLMFLILIVLGGAIAGTITEKQFISFNEECFDMSDNNNDGNEDIGQDQGCTEYPYEDGNGEDGTSLSNRYTSDIDKYQTGYDLLADYVKNSIEKGCNGDAAQCGITGVTNEVQMFCYLESNAAGLTFTQMVQSWRISANFDDGSYQMIQDLCYIFPPSSLTELPVINFQNY